MAEETPEVKDHDIIESVDQIKNIHDLDSMSISSYKIFRDKYLSDENIILPPLEEIRGRFGSCTELLKICGLRGNKSSAPNRDLNIPEGDIVEYTVGHFKSLFPEEVTTEYAIRDTKGDYIGKADVAIEDRMIVIECKDTRTTNIRGGVGQAVYYNIGKYEAYLSLYDRCIRDNDISVCNDVGIGLIGVTPDDLNVYVESGTGISISDTGIDGL